MGRGVQEVCGQGSNKEGRQVKLPVKYSETHFSVRKLVRQEYVKRQDGLCYHCWTDLRLPPPKEITDKSVDKSLFPDGFFKWPVHLHHDHDTDLTIGAVHNYCNAVLWQHHGE